MFFIGSIKRKTLGVFFLSHIFFLTACSNTTKTSPESSVDSVISSVDDSVADSNTATESVDKLENLNRGIYNANAAFDKNLFKPVAKAYKAVVPEPIDISITNFFLNLGEISNVANNLLQFKVGDALKDTERFIFNSTFGVAGFFDIATEMGLEKHHEDFGQTLAVWGVESGPYLMLPFFGPSTLRDATAQFSVDLLTDPKIYSKEQYGLLAVEKIDSRADLFSTEEALKDLSDDPYIALRDAWLQRREYLIRDGKVDEKEQSDLIDELEDLDDD